MAENKHEKFLRLAPDRTDAAIKRIELLGNLAGSGYEYSATEVTQMFDAIEAALEATKARFAKTPKRGKAGFSFKELRRAAE